MTEHEQELRAVLTRAAEAEAARQSAKERGDTMARWAAERELAFGDATAHLSAASGSFDPDVFTSQPRPGSAVDYGVGISYILQGTNDQIWCKTSSKLLMRLGELRLARKLPSYVKNNFRLRDEQPRGDDMASQNTWPTAQTRRVQ